MKHFIKWLLYFLAIVFLYVIIVLIHGTISDFQPPLEKELTSSSQAMDKIVNDSVLSFAIWNIGYGGLGEESNFFFDGGSMWFAGKGMVRPKKEMVEKNLKGVNQILGAIPSDFWLLQEVDLHSKRSYFINQEKELKKVLPDYSVTFAENYVAPRVPLPILEPWRVYGKVNSGLSTFSKYDAKKAKRLQLPGEYPWPTKIFQLDRCAAVHRYSTNFGGELVVINIHNSAFDEGGVLKAQQMAFLKDLFLAEYEKGNFVIAGGDWNQCPPFFQYNILTNNKTLDDPLINIDPSFMPESWKWIYDARLPTNRSVSESYQKGETFVTVIDFFLVSPNVKVLKAKGINIDFQFSDHQPVWMEVQLLDKKK